MEARKPTAWKLALMSAAVVLATLSLAFVPYFACGRCGDPPKSVLYRCSECHSTGRCTLLQKIRFLTVVGER
jgi:hypothetical protein